MLAISILFKLMVFLNGLQFETFDKIGRFANIFILMTGVFFAIRLYKVNVKESSSYLDDFKAGMRVASLYAVGMAVFLYFYYEFIDTAYFESRIGMIKSVNSDNPDFDPAKAREMLEFVYSAFFNSTVSLLGYLLLGSFYSALIAFLVRKFSGLQHKNI